MEKYQFWTLVTMMAAGFGWMITWLRSIDKSVNDIDKRVTVLETRMGFIERLLEMAANSKSHFKEKTDP